MAILVFLQPRDLEFPLDLFLQPRDLEFPLDLFLQPRDLEFPPVDPTGIVTPI